MVGKTHFLGEKRKKEKRKEERLFQSEKKKKNYLMALNSHISIRNEVKKW